MSEDRRTLDHEEWIAEARSKFGDDAREWQFICPRCNTVQGVPDFEKAGLSRADLDRYLAFSCIGRFADGIGCDWTLGGLLTIHALEVEFEDGTKRPTFEFAPTHEGTG